MSWSPGYAEGNVLQQRWSFAFSISTKSRARLELQEVVTEMAFSQDAFVDMGKEQPGTAG